MVGALLRTRVVLVLLVVVARLVGKDTPLPPLLLLLVPTRVEDDFLLPTRVGAVTITSGMPTRVTISLENTALVAALMEQRA